MKAAGGGKIINIGSMMSIFGASFTPAYAASKGGIVQFTRSCACAWAADNIQANAILPGWIDTDLTKRAREQIDGLHDRVLARTPAARWGAISDFAVPCSWPRQRLTSSPARPSRSTAVIRSWAEAGGSISR
jgi:2-dehydro-3-deoxy-D-gluconate 5-dehydrogenase